MVESNNKKGETVEYSVAYNWDEKLLKGFCALNRKSQGDKITEIFGSSAFSLFGSANAGLPEVKKEEIERQIGKAKELGFSFNYLVNAISYPEIKTAAEHEEALRYFEWLSNMSVDSVTIANEDILDFVYANFPKLKVNISIVMGIKTVQEVEELRKRFPNIHRVILHHTINRDRDSIIDHVKSSRIKQGESKTVGVELLANEICLYDCPRMKAHYIALTAAAQKREGPEFDWDLCGEIRAGDIRSFLDACWIRPEDVHLYQELGVGMLKIAGRKESTNDLLKRAAAYMGRSYEGNVMDLFLAEFWPDSSPPYIGNRQLDGYLEELWSDGKKKLDSTDKIMIKYDWS